MSARGAGNGGNMTPRNRNLATYSRAAVRVGALVFVALCVPGALWAQTPPLGAVYTKAQAARGERVFLNNCAGCHGYSMITIFSRYRNAYDYHSVVSLTMPWEDAAQLIAQDYIDIVAYMMRENGFAAGDTELVPDRALLERIIPSQAGSP